MGFIRSPKLKAEIEEQLKQEMHFLWKKNFSGKKIAYQLGFGDPEFIENRDAVNKRAGKVVSTFKVDERYRKLRVYHVYFYRNKWQKLHEENPEENPLSFRRRKKPPRRKGQSRYNVKHDEMMSFDEFKEMLNESVTKFDFSLLTKEQRERPLTKNEEQEYKAKLYCAKIRAYCILHFWTPLRVSELIERKRCDFTYPRGLVKINLFRKKKYYRPNAKPEPFYLRQNYPMVNEVINYLNEIEDPDERPFDFTRWTAWNFIREIFGSYPHHFRFSYITRGVETSKDPGQLITTLLSDTGLDIGTVTGYVMAPTSKYRNTLNDQQMELIKMAQRK